MITGGGVPLFFNSLLCSDVQVDMAREPSLPKGGGLYVASRSLSVWSPTWGMA
jgi:hypothetical protein